MTKEERAYVRKLEKHIRSFIKNYPYDVEDCVERHSGKACKRCQVVIDAKETLEAKQ